MMEHEFGGSFATADATGVSTKGDQNLIFLERHGYLEEVHADWAVIGIPGGEHNLGYYNYVVEVTKRVLYERRTQTLLEVERQTCEATDVKEFWHRILLGLEPNHFDVPFALLYSAAPHGQDSGGQHLETADDASSSERNSVFGTTLWTLEGTLGLPANCNAAPSQIDSETAAKLFTSSFEDDISAGKLQFMRDADGTLANDLHAVAKSRAYGDTCNTAVLCPIELAHRGRRRGFLILGLNPRRDYDYNYEQYVVLLIRHLNTSLASISLAEDKTLNARNLADVAALDRIRLSEKLAITQHEAKESEQKFRTAAAHVPVAMFEMTTFGDLLYANDSYYDLTSVDRNNLYPYCWLDTVLTADRPHFEDQWTHLVAGEPVRFEVRLTKPFVADDFVPGESSKFEGETWVLVAAYAQRSSEDAVTTVQGALVDISRQKWMAAIQERRVQEAVELKRQQEAFMDMVGHEARNPLAAITLCIDTVLNTLEDILRSAEEQVTISRDTVETITENADIIMACVQHQKRIIDDVLTLSKLDSGLLVIAPCEVEPSTVIAQSLKMFEAELQQAAIDLEYIIDHSYRDLGVEWALLDPSRLTQILINLVTNAIKFTQKEESRLITVSLSASTVPPLSSSKGTKFLKPLDSEADEVESPEQDGSAIYLSIAVEDTGCGIKENELEKLFHRFQQASPKTHVQYGGSGLGLFISRELARLQGGRVGVASKAGVGSTFEFYIKAARCVPPRHPLLQHRSSKLSTSSKRSSRTASSDTQEKIDPLLGSKHHEEEMMTEQETSTICHILLVEDNLVNQKVMYKQLQRASYEVSLAGHGGEALEHIRKTSLCRTDGVQLDAVLMDIEMPVMGGLECTRKIRAMEDSGEITLHVPILAITANVRAEQQAAAFDAGMDAVVTKPFRLNQLLPELERVRQIHRDMPN